MARRAIPTPVPMLNIEERVFTGAADMRTVAADSPVWSDPGHVLRYVTFREGSFVRVFPPAGVGDEMVASVRRVLEEKCGARVRVMPRPGTLTSPVPAVKRISRTAREVCEALVEEVPSRDRDRLRVLAEEIMAEAGV